MRDLSAVHQSILTMEDNSDDDNILGLKEIRTENKHCRRQARKIRRLHDTMVQETLEFTSNLFINNSISKVSTSSAKDHSNQKSYTEHHFRDKSSLENLTDDLKVESLARLGWTTILNVKTANGKVSNILDSSAIITEKDIENARHSRSAEEYNDSKNLLIATWRLITNKPKRAMAKY